MLLFICLVSGWMFCLLGLSFIAGYEYMRYVTENRMCDHSNAKFPLLAACDNQKSTARAQETIR